MILSRAGITTLKPGSATKPFPTIDAAVFDNAGGGGYLVIRKPWPAMLRGIYGDPKRRETYPLEGHNFVGDGRASTRTATSGCSAGWTTS